MASDLLSTNITNLIAQHNNFAAYIFMHKVNVLTLTLGSRLTMHGEDNLAAVRVLARELKEKIDNPQWILSKPYMLVGLHAFEGAVKCITTISGVLENDINPNNVDTVLLQSSIVLSKLYSEYIVMYNTSIYNTM